MSKISDAANNAKAKASGRLSSAKARASEGGAAAKRKAGEIYGRSRDVATRGAENSKEMARKAREKSGETVDNNPIVAVAGGLALGAIIGALLPTSQRERNVMGGTGKKINARAKAAVDAASKAGREHMAEVGLDADNAKEQFKTVFDKASKTAKAAGTAAKDAAKKGA